MLQRYKFQELSERLLTKGISIYELCEEVDRFVTYMNSIDFTDNFIEKIERVRKTESSLKTIINIIFSKMNPELNLIIKEEDLVSNNYNGLVLRLERLTTEIGRARQDLTTSLKNKVDIETNVLTNNSNISFFISSLTSIFEDLIYHSLKQACDSILSIEVEAGIPIKKENKIIILKTSADKMLFYYLVYAYFLRTLQSTIPIFSNLKPLESNIKILPPEAMEFQRLYNRPQQIPQQNQGISLSISKEIPKSLPTTSEPIEEGEY